MKTVYLASRYSRIVEMNVRAETLRAYGFIVHCRWINGEHEFSDDGLSIEASRSERERFALEDWIDLGRADIVINFTESPRSSNSRGGRHVEYGAALAWGKLCLIVGPRENVFHCLDHHRVRHFDTWPEALSWLACYRDAGEVLGLDL